MNTIRPQRSTSITVMAILAIVVGALGSLISIISAAMLKVGSYGTANANPLDALVILLGPPFVLAAGIGLLLRKRWAWFSMAVILFAALGWQAWQIASPPPREDRTYISPSGVPTTVLGSEPTYSPMMIAASLAMLAILFSRKSRAQFGPWLVTAAPREEQRREMPAVSGGSEWRVGHQGRDQIFYEERLDGAWQRIVIDGEMLMGRPHHVIYFASPESWHRYPEWARHRRDEIIARIKSQFREPDYEYSDGGTASTFTVPASFTPASHGPAQAKAMTSSEIRALLAFLAILLGIAGGMAWLVGTGLKRGETYWPAKRNSQQRVVSQAKEPVMFWTSIGVYSSIGFGALGFSVCMIRWSRK